MDLTQETLLEMLEEAAPTRLLCIAPTPPASVTHWVGHGEGRQVEHVAPTGALRALGELGRFDYAIVTEALASLDVTEGMALIARLRDVHCHRFAVTHRHAPAVDDPWTDGRFLSLTLALHRRVTEGDGIETSVYAYDIDTYNRQREWNSPADWANPQNFHRWRW